MMSNKNHCIMEITEQEYNQLKQDSENLKAILEEKYEVMEYFPVIGGYKKIYYVSKANNGLLQVLNDVCDQSNAYLNILRKLHPEIQGII